MGRFSDFSGSNHYVDSIDDRFNKQEIKIKNIARLLSLVQELVENQLPNNLLQTSKSTIDYRQESENNLSHIGKL